MKFPVTYSDFAAGLTLIVAIRCCTTIRDESLVPPASVATMYAAPLATAVTRPLVLTVAADVLRLSHVQLPATTLPAASRPVTVSGRVPVMEVIVSTCGETVVEARAPAPRLAVTASGEPDRPLEVTDSACAPDAPNVHVVLAMPLPLVVAVGVPRVPAPLVTANVTVAPATGLPNASCTLATIGCANAVENAPVCPLPDTRARVAADAAVTSNALDVALVAPEELTVSV